MPNDPRQALERLCAERGEDFAGLSRFLGRNPAYIQQYIRRGTPRRLGEAERQKLARYFGVPEATFGGPAGGQALPGLVPVKRIFVRASAGAGALPDGEAGAPYFAFDAQWLRRLTAAPPETLAIIRVEGDSMAPTLADGDDLLVDPVVGADSLRDGIYVLRVDGALLVKRLAIHPLGRRVTVQSDNPAYPDWPDCSLAEIDCVGRVIWAGHRFA